MPLQTYESQFQIGERIKLHTGKDHGVWGYVRSITFTSSKVRYSIYLEELKTTYHNVDSAFVSDVAPGDEGSMDFGEDNYS